MIAAFSSLLDVVDGSNDLAVDHESSTLTQQEQFDRTRKCIDLLKSSGYSCPDVTASGRFLVRCFISICSTDCSFKF